MPKFQTRNIYGSSLDLAIDSRVMEVVMLLTIDLGCLGCVNDFVEIQSLWLKKSIDLSPGMFEKVVGTQSLSQDSNHQEIHSSQR